jgi:hypothetical protein
LDSDKKINFCIPVVLFEIPFVVAVDLVAVFVLSDFTMRFSVPQFFTVIFSLVVRQCCSQTAQFLFSVFLCRSNCFTAARVLVNDLVLWVSCWQILSTVDFLFLTGFAAPVMLVFHSGAKAPASVAAQDSVADTAHFSSWKSCRQSSPGSSLCAKRYVSRLRPSEPVLIFGSVYQSQQ